MLSRALDDDVGLMHKRTNDELTPAHRKNRDFRVLKWDAGIGYQDNPAKSGMISSCQNAAVLAKSATLLFERLLRVYRSRAASLPVVRD